jgi:alanine racemase
MSGKGIVEIHGKPAKILGNVCMDQMMVDVTEIPEVEPGDEAVLWGGTVSDSAETIAEKTGTISYEVLCGVARRVPRIYKRDGIIADTVDYLNG